MKEYALANSLYWALAEGHACEQSARRNAMDVSQNSGILEHGESTDMTKECLKECW